MKTHSWIVTKDKFLTEDEIRRLYAALLDAKDLALARKTFLNHVRAYFIIRTLFETGIRVAELTGLQIQNVQRGCLIVRNGKGGKSRNILLTPETQKLFREFIKVKKTHLNEPTSNESSLFLSERRKSYTTRGIRKLVKYWFKKCGFNPNLSVHSCRHSYISHLIAKGIDLETVRNNAGHSSLSVTSIYSHLVRDDLNEFTLYSAEFDGKRNNSTNRSPRKVKFED